MIVHVHPVDCGDIIVHVAKHVYCGVILLMCYRYFFSMLRPAHFEQNKVGESGGNLGI